MANTPIEGDKVSTKAKRLLNRGGQNYLVPMTGTVVTARPHDNLFLVDFGPGFDGHDGGGSRQGTRWWVTKTDIRTVRRIDVTEEL